MTLRRPRCPLVTSHRNSLYNNWRDAGACMHGTHWSAVIEVSRIPALNSSSAMLLLILLTAHNSSGHLYYSDCVFDKSAVLIICYNWLLLWLRSIVISASVCLFVCPLAYLKNHSTYFTKFSIHVTCGVGVGSVLFSAIRYVLPVLWMASFFTH